MKLAIARQRYTPFGGAERFISRTLQELYEQGTDVTIIARRWNAIEETMTGREYSNTKLLRNDPFYVGRIWRDASFAHGVQNIIATGYFDLIQSHERIPGCHIFRAGDGVHAAWLDLRARYAGHNEFWHKLSPWHQYTLHAEKCMFNHSALKAVICISQMVQNDIYKHYRVDKSKLHVIYNGIDLEYFHPRLSQQHRHQVRQQLNVSNNSPVFLYVGSGYARKGVSTLIEAAAKMRNKDVQFWIIGKDKAIAKYKSMTKAYKIGNQFNFLGGQSDIRPYLGAADVFVLPTIYEPLSNAVLEALACGLPAVVTNTCGASELITTGENGYVMNTGDTNMLSIYLGELSNIKNIHDMKIAARQSVSHLSITNMSKKLLSFYNQFHTKATTGI